MDRWMDGEETDEWISEVKDGRGEPEPWKVFPRAVTDLSTSAYTLLLPSFPVIRVPSGLWLLEQSHDGPPTREHWKQTGAAEGKGLKRQECATQVSPKMGCEAHGATKSDRALATMAGSDHRGTQGTQRGTWEY